MYLAFSLVLGTEVLTLREMLEWYNGHSGEMDEHDYKGGRVVRTRPRRPIRVSSSSDAPDESTLLAYIATYNPLQRHQLRELVLQCWSGGGDGSGGSSTEVSAGGYAHVAAE